MSEPTGSGSYVQVRAYAELNDFLPAESRGVTVRRPFRSHQTVKDVLEAMGIPHTEVDLILVNGSSQGFGYRPSAGDRIAAYPVFEALDVASTSRLRPDPLRDPRFVVDVNLGRLARLLRLLGLDVWWASDANDASLAEVSRDGQRILLTRDRGLLKRRVITHGLFVHSQDPEQQAVEVIRRLDLAPTAGAVHAVPAVRRHLGQGRKRRGDRPAAADDAAVLPGLQPLPGVRPDLLGRVALRQAGCPGRKAPRTTLIPPGLAVTLVHSCNVTGMAMTTCSMCGGDFSARSDAIYCSPACRQKAHRARTAQRTALLREALSRSSGAAGSLRPSVAATLQRARDQVDRSRELRQTSERRLRESDALLRRRPSWPGN